MEYIFPPFLLVWYTS